MTTPPNSHSAEIQAPLQCQEFIQLLYSILVADIQQVVQFAEQSDKLTTDSFYIPMTSDTSVVNDKHTFLNHI